MYPIPPSKPLPYIPRGIKEQIIASFPDPFSERDEYSSIAQAAREFTPSIRRHRFRRITILASACYQKQNMKALRLLDILGASPDIAMVVRHVEIDYQLQNDTSQDNVDIYPPLRLGKLFEVCSNITSASIHNFDSSHFCHPTMDTSTIFAKQTFLVPIVELTNTSLTNLELVNFRGKLSDFCKFIRAFGPDPVVHINLRESSLVELGSSNCLCLKKVKSFQFDGNTTGSDDALLHILGSKHTIFPNLEQVRYGFYEPLDRLSRVLQQAQGSLKVLQLNCGPLKRRFSSETLILPPLLEAFNFRLDPIRVGSRFGPLGPESYAESLKAFGQISSLKRIQLILTHFSETWENFGDLSGLDEILASDELGVENLTVVISGRGDIPSKQQQNSWLSFLEQNLPNVHRRFFRKENIADRRQGAVRWMLNDYLWL